jgi:8-amino-7-oxononanoate synthase
VNQITSFLSQIESLGFYPKYRTISSGLNEPICVVDGKEYLQFCANNYLGMSQNPEVKQAGINAIMKYGMGPGGARVISGDVDIIHQLESAIAKLTGTEDCITFPTGYMANISVFAAVMDPVFMEAFGTDGIRTGGSVIFSDEFNHGSIVDGCRLSNAKKVVFRHNDLSHLKESLELYKEYPNKLIVTEGVFSLDGEITEVTGFVELAKIYQARLMIDDAHGIGVIGHNGGGVAEVYNCGNDIDILMGCMDKAFGGTGGFLCGSNQMIKYLRIATRSSLLSSAIPAGMAGAMLEAVNQINIHHDLIEQVNENANYLRKKLRDAGFTILGGSNIPALALFIGDEKLALKFEEELWNNSIFCQVVRWPAVKRGKARFRVIVMAQHSTQQLDRFAAIATKVGKKLKVIKRN